MKIAKIWRRRRAVSPILAAILLIGLAVAAGAVLFIIVLPMIQGGGELYITGVTFSDTDSPPDDVKDKLVFTLTNELKRQVTVTNITINADGEIISNNTHTSTTFPFNIAVSASKIGITFTGLDPEAATSITIVVSYKIGDEVQEPLVSSAIEA
ncbi:MAG: archaellin/type IV pilin N-terminal domain-containing protein [Candidatus Hodarchaeota archaeon]